MGLTKIPVFHARLFIHCCLIAQYKACECLFVQLSTKYIEKNKFLKWEIRKLENVIFPSSAEPCRILQNSAFVPQNSAEHFGENHEILRISAEFCGIPQNGFCSTELFCGTTKRNNILQKSAELSKSLLRNSAGVFGSAELFCGTLYYQSILRNSSEAISEVLQNSVEFLQINNCPAERFCGTIHY